MRKVAFVLMALAAACSDTALEPHTMDAAPGTDVASVAGSDAGLADAPVPPSDAVTSSGDAQPLRLVVMVTHHGVIPQTFWPTAGASSPDLSGPLSPLSPFADLLTQVRGIDMVVSPPWPASGIGLDDSVLLPLLLTGRIKWEQGGLLAFRSVALAPSIDAALLGPGQQGACFFAGPPALDGPGPFWTQAGAPRSCPMALSEFSSSLARAPAAGDSLVGSADFFRKDLGHVFDLATNALATLQARTFGFVVTPPTTVMTELAGYAGQGDWHEFIHHYNPGNPTGGTSAQVIEAFTRLTRYHAELFAQLAGKLNDHRQPDGSSLLDHTLMLWISPFGHPSHGLKDLPVVILGAAHGRLRTNLFVDVGRRSFRDLLATLAAALEIPSTWTADLGGTEIEALSATP